MNFKIGLLVIVALMLIVQANLGFSFDSDDSNDKIMSKRVSKIEELLKDKKSRSRFYNVGKRSIDMN